MKKNENKNKMNDSLFEMKQRLWKETLYKNRHRIAFFNYAIPIALILGCLGWIYVIYLEVFT